MRQFANKRDQNEREIITALLSAGASVEQISKKGVYDLMVGFRGLTYNLEVKMPDGELTSDEEDWGNAWQGHKAVVRSVDEALRAIGAIL